MLIEFMGCWVVRGLGRVVNPFVNSSLPKTLEHLQYWRAFNLEFKVCRLSFSCQPCHTGWGGRKPTPEECEQQTEKNADASEEVKEKIERQRRT